MYTALPTAPALHITAPAQPPRLKPVRVSGLVFDSRTSILTEEKQGWIHEPAEVAGVGQER